MAKYNALKTKGSHVVAAIVAIVDTGKSAYIKCQLLAFQQSGLYIPILILIIPIVIILIIH